MAVLTRKRKEEIDSMSYAAMLRRWRFALPKDPLFQGDSGVYYSKVMRLKRNKLGIGEHARISKELGW